jgi:DNA-binding transcriptional MerR regulator
MPERVTVGEAARRSGLTPKAIRLYEARGLLPRATRTESGYRLYDIEDVQTLRFVRHARGLGLGLERIKAILEARGSRTAAGHEALAVMEAHLEELERDAVALAARRGEVSTLLERARAAHDRGESRPLCRAAFGQQAERCCRSAREPGSVE